MSVSPAAAQAHSDPLRRLVGALVGVVLPTGDCSGEHRRPMATYWIGCRTWPGRTLKKLAVTGCNAVLHADAIRPPTAIEVLTRVVERDDSAISANSTRREERDPVPLLRKACAEYLDALAVAAESVLGPETLAQIEAHAVATVPGITDYPAWPALNAQLQRLALDGADVYQVLRDEAMLVRRDCTREVAAILASRLDANQRETGPLPWLPPVPRQLAEDDFWGRYFDRRHELIERHGSAVRADATSWTPETAPAWAVPRLSDPSLTRDLAVWRAARDVPDTDLRPTGPPANDRAGGYVQRRLDRRVAQAGELQTTHEPAAARLAEAIHPGITADPQWPTLARQIAAADEAGIDRAELRRIATGRPLPIEAPAAALAYRLIDAIGDRPAAAAKLSKPAAPRRYDPAPLPNPPTNHPRLDSLGPASRPGPRRRRGGRRGGSVPDFPRGHRERATFWVVGATPCHILLNGQLSQVR